MTVAGDEARKITREALNPPADKVLPPAYAQQRAGGRARPRFDAAPSGQVGVIAALESQTSADMED